MTLDISESSIDKFKFKPNSSLIEYLDFDGATKNLKVRFKRGKYKGKTRLYQNVSAEEFCRIMNSESVGKSVIKLSVSHTAVDAGVFYKFTRAFSFLF